MRKTKRHINPFPLLAVICVILLCAYMVHNFSDIFKNDILESTPTQNAEISVNNMPTEKTKDINVFDIENTHNLWLVNYKNKLPDSKIIETVSAYKTIALSRNNIDLKQETLTQADRMFEAAKKDNMMGYVVTSGYRTTSEQREIYNEASDKSFVSLPGHSEHQTGLAVDIQLMRGLIDGTKEGKWLRDSAYKFGFILRYSEDKTDITKISYEPWHFRYVGVAHAAFMKENNFCFEEYIDWLKEGKQYKITVMAKTYQVYRVIPENGKIKVPVSGQYEISDDNVGGYIITETM